LGDVPTPNAPAWFSLQTIALEFRVAQRLDGITPSPPFLIPPDPSAVIDPSSGAVVIEVDRLGLIDLTGGLNGGFATRIVRSFLIAGPLPVFGGDEAAIGLSYDGVSTDSGVVEIPAGSNGLASENCIIVPPTAMVRITGLTATPGNPILVRLCVWQPRTVEELAEMSQVCCCRFATLDAEGEPYYTNALYFGAACERTVTSVAPPTAARGVGPQAVLITGTGFVEGDEIFFVSSDGTGMINVMTSAVINETTINAAIDVDGAVPLGDYNVIVAPPLAPPQCQGVGEDLFAVT